MSKVKLVALSVLAIFVVVIISVAVLSCSPAEDKEMKKDEAEPNKMVMPEEKDMQNNMMVCVNSKCPISGKEFDRMKVPEDCTRMYKGMRIGFYSSMYPPPWDDLTDEEKDVKLKEVMPPKE